MAGYRNGCYNNTLCTFLKILLIANILDILINSCSNIGLDTCSCKNTNNRQNNKQYNEKCNKEYEEEYDEEYDEEYEQEYDECEGYCEYDKGLNGDFDDNYDYEEEYLNEFSDEDIGDTLNEELVKDVEYKDVQELDNTKEDGEECSTSYSKYNDISEAKINLNNKTTKIYSGISHKFNSCNIKSGKDFVCKGKVIRNEIINKKKQGMTEKKN